ncbi:hypothetical protein Ndes2526B_g04771 [Nannochloris sp. 'desiccata']
MRQIYTVTALLATLPFLLLIPQIRALDPLVPEDSAAIFASLEGIDEDGLPAAVGPTAAPSPVPLSKAERLLEKAHEIRRNPNASEKDLKRAVDFLYASAGIEHLSIEKRSTITRSKNNITAAAVEIDDDFVKEEEEEGQEKLPTADDNKEYADSDTGTFITAADVKIHWRNATIQYPPAAKELIFVFREGDGVPLNPAIAHRLLQELAAHGDTEAQADIAFYLSQGIEPVAPNPRGLLFTLVQPDLPAALVYLYFAAKAGDPIAQMSLGYRFLYGLGVPKSCQTAALYYVPVAERVLEMAKLPDSLPQIKNFRLNHKTATASNSKPTVEQEFLHYQWFADYGHADAARAVAHLLSHGAARDHAAAVQYLRQAAQAGDVDAMAHLGHMHANGLAVEQDNATAWRWFWRAAEKGHASGLFGLGYMHLTGQGAEVDHKQAFNYFKQAVENGSQWSGLGDALFFLGTMHMKGLGTPIDLGQAAAMYNAASAAGNLLASYNLGVLHLRGLAGEAKGPASCRAAVMQLKRLSERAWPALPEAHEDFAAGDYEWALLNYMKAAEWGSELGQSNAAWMLSEGYGYEGPRSGSAAVALFRRAAEQGNAAALVRLGDSYWYGKGVPRDWTRAGRAYTAAAKHRLPQALFNLGFMHQHGAGVAKDFHLAKRYYDRAAVSTEEAWLAATLALMGLQVQRWWERVEPMLPMRWQRIGRSVFVGVQTVGTTIFGGSSLGGGNSTAGVPSMSLSSDAGAGAGVSGTKLISVSGGRAARGPFGRIRRLFSISTILSVLDGLDSSFDSQMALWIMGLLAVVLWRRQTLRARALQRQQQHQWNAAPAGNGAAAVNDVAELPVGVENREDNAAAAAAAAEARRARAVVEEPAQLQNDTVPQGD